MKTIYKYPIKDGTTLDDIIFTIDSFKGANFISTGYDCNNRLCVWAEVDTDAPESKFCIYVLGTGWNLDGIYANLDKNEKLKYLGIINDYPYIWHIYWKEDKDLWV